MNCVELYNIATAGFLDARIFEILEGGFSAVAIGWLYRRFAGDAARSRASLFLFAGLAFALYGGVQIYQRWVSYKALKAQFVAGNYATVSGVVDGFRPEYYGGRFDSRNAHERFTIGGVTFSYSGRDVASGFTKGYLEHGPIHPGMHLQVDYVGDRIVRIRKCN